MKEKYSFDAMIAYTTAVGQTKRKAEASGSGERRGAENNKYLFGDALKRKKIRNYVQ